MFLIYGIIISISSSLINSSTHAPQVSICISQTEIVLLKYSITSHGPYFVPYPQGSSRTLIQLWQRRLLDYRQRSLLRMDPKENQHCLMFQLRQGRPLVSAGNVELICSDGRPLPLAKQTYQNFEAHCSQLHPGLPTFFQDPISS